jgi:hypothetical protein
MLQSILYIILIFQISRHENTKYMPWLLRRCKIRIPGLGGLHPCTRREKMRSLCESTPVCECAEERKKRVTHGTYARQCMLALLPFLAPPPHLSRPRATRPSVCMYNGSTAREPTKGDIPFALCLCGSSTHEEKIVDRSWSRTDLHGRLKRRNHFQFTTAITIACVALRLRLNRQFAFRIRNVLRDTDRII